jgi:hypothetical protein
MDNSKLIIKKILREHCLDKSDNVNDFLNILLDLSKGKRGVGVKRANMVTYHGMGHVADVLKFSLDNFVAYNEGVFAENYSAKEDVACAVLAHDFGYFLMDEKVDFGTMKIGHEYKGTSFVEELVREGSLDLGDGRLENIKKIVHATILDGSIKIDDLNSAVDVGMMMIGIADIVGAGEGYVASIPRLYDEFNEDAEVLRKFLERDDIDGESRTRAEMELGKIPVASGAKEEIEMSKKFLDYVYDVVVKDVLCYVSDMGHAAENRAKIERIYSGTIRN